LLKAKSNILGRHRKGGKTKKLKTERKKMTKEPIRNEIRNIRVRRTSVLALLIVLTFAISLVACLPAAFSAAVPDRKTGTFCAVSPKLAGLGQELTMNLWTWPAMSGPHLYTPIQEHANTPGASLAGLIAAGWHNLTVTITKPDGTKSTFMPVDATLKNIGIDVPGLTQPIGAILFYYTPDQVGTWSMTASFPGETIKTADSSDTVYYLPSTSEPFTFTIQQDKVIQSGMLTGWPYSPLPTGYWDRPISINNREWFQISGNWPMLRYNNWATCYNPYSTAPNTAHLVWKRQIGLGGLVGGEWGSLSMELRDTTGGTPPIVMDGKIFFREQSGNMFDAVDLRTGALLYRASGAISLGQVLRPFFQTASQSAGAEAMLRGYLWELGSTAWKTYDPLTGATLQTFSNVASGIQTSWFEDGNPVVFCTQRWGWNTTIPYKYAGEYLVKWDLNQVKNSVWQTGVVWNVSLRQSDGQGVGDGRISVAAYVFDGANVVIAKASNDENIMFGFDMTTGKYLWRTSMDFIDLGTWMGGMNGPIMMWDGAVGSVHGFDVKTGQEIWETPVGEGPWRTTSPYTWVVGKENLYICNFDGHIYAVNMANGNVVWKSDYFGDTTETIYGTYGFRYGAAGADGKLYFGSGPIYDVQPGSRFHKLYCIDESTGKFLWNVSGVLEPRAIADGYLVILGQWDGLLYTFGKGKTETTVTASPKVPLKGAGVLIEGTVLDMSPAQVGTPAVSDEDMSEWMDYLQMQNATLLNSPPNPKGVQVKLTAVDPSGKTVDLGTVTPDSKGAYSTIFTPTSEGKYTIVADFAGSGSYWSSSAETAIGVAQSITTPAPTATSNTATVEQQQSTNMYVLAVGLVLIVLVIAAIVLLVRKRK
jgi:outer membrane protein assembly factor BamB